MEKQDIDGLEIHRARIELPQDHKRRLQNMACLRMVKTARVKLLRFRIAKLDYTTYG